MIAVIRVHNRLNGIRFSTVEFAAMAAVVAPFAIYYLLHGELALGLVATGFSLNCLPVVAFGLRAWVGVGDVGGSIWDAKARERLRRENHHMLRDTLLLAGTTLLPFLLLALVLGESLSPRLARGL